MVQKIKQSLFGIPRDKHFEKKRMALTFCILQPGLRLQQPFVAIHVTRP